MFCQSQVNEIQSNYFKKKSDSESLSCISYWNLIISTICSNSSQFLKIEICRYVIPNCSQKLFHDLAPIFGGLSQSDNLFETKPPSIPGKNGYLCPAYSRKSGAQISRKKCAETEI